MVRCSKCGYVGVYLNEHCPDCKEKIILTAEEIDEKIAEISYAEEKKQYELLAECHHILADLGRLDSQKEYASMLERGEIVTRNLDEAMKYYYMAAEKNDAYSAFRYARLAERTNEKVASFWLSYAAALGCVESFPTLAEKLARDGDDAQANFYYAMSAAYDDRDSIVTMAKRYYNGVGCEQNHSFAKWYMDKLTLPPIHAIKIAYKLRNVRAEDPGTPKHPDYDRLLRILSIKAHDYGYKNAYHHLCKMLSDRGDMQARMILGMLYAQGIGCKQDTAKAFTLLESSATNGNAEAYKNMGGMYADGILIERDIDKALECYTAAAKLGMTEAYEIMGDIFCMGEVVKRDVNRAIELYDIGAKMGHTSAAAKSNDLKRRREELFERAKNIEARAPIDAFRTFAISASMGYIPAYKYIGRCFRDGRGIKKDNSQAFLWFERAVENKDDSALLEYGTCYSRGIGVAFNYKTAVQILSTATRLGSEDAKAELERLMINKRNKVVGYVYSRAMRLLYKKKYMEAEELLQICLKFNHAKGIYALGCLNEFGFVPNSSKTKAFQLYDTSFELGFRDPSFDHKLSILRIIRKNSRI